MKSFLYIGSIKEFFLSLFKSDNLEDCYRKFFRFSPFQIGLNLLIRTIVTVGVMGTGSEVLFFLPASTPVYAVRYSLLALLSLINLFYVFRLIKNLTDSGGAFNYLKKLLWADAILSFWFVFSIVTKLLIWIHWKKELKGRATTILPDVSVN